MTSPSAQLQALDSQQREINERRNQLRDQIAKETAFWRNIDGNRLVNRLRQFIESNPDENITVLIDTKFGDVTAREFITGLVAPSGDPANENTYARLSERDLTVTDVFTAVTNNDDVRADLGSTSIGDLLDAVPRFGARRIEALLERVDVDTADDLDSLSAAQMFKIALATDGSQTAQILDPHYDPEASKTDVSIAEYDEEDDQAPVADESVPVIDIDESDDDDN